MIVYIAGKMSGLPDLGRENFRRLEKKLTDRGHVVLNPAVLPVGLRPESYMPICLAMIDAADAVCIGNGWETSKGAKIELRYAEYQGKLVFYEDELAEKGCEEKHGV